MINNSTSSTPTHSPAKGVGDTSSAGSLKRKTVRGGVVAMGAQMMSIAIQLLSTVILSRLLPSEDFGIIAMIVAITAFMGLFRDMGLSTASIQKQSLQYVQVNALFWLNVLAGSVLSVATVLLAPALAWFYKKPEVTPVAVLMSVTFLVSSVGAQHAALMQRELRFLPKATADVAGAVVNFTLAVCLALLGYRYWSLAWGVVAGACVTTGLYFYGSKFRPGRPRRAEGLRDLLGFGANVTAFEVVNYFHRNLDNVLIGRVWGASALGLYSRAYQLMMLPIVSLRTPINAVALPVLSRLQNEPSRYRHYYCEIASLLGMLSIPLMLFLAINADDVVQVALGPGWSGVGPIFVLLALTGLIQPVASLRGLVLLSLGRTRKYLVWGVLNAAVVCLGFCIGVRWGGVGVAAAYAISNYLLLYPSIVFAFKESPLRVSDFFVTLARPVLAGLIAVAASWGAQGLAADHPVILQLIFKAIVFGLVFAATALILPGGKQQLTGYLAIVKSLRK
ncbi:lipopolysaccharide biosynthesis protein [Stenotrophomonas sp. TWI809]|uniref:lipopolysaccharide biosynthesis protein n=1 Tax=Stenotrophomonas sp. TWI809 TaxID=3136796 RepID=UPI00320A51C6